MKEKYKTAIAFAALGIAVAAGFLLSLTERDTDVYPDENTRIYLYGEAHGTKTYYDRELSLWEGYYAEGCRDLFLELPYYSAEFLNLWMRSDSDELIDQWFEEVHGTLSGNEHYHAFFHGIKERCPETVFYGTDVGHQADTTGVRYLSYLEESGRAGSDDYVRAAECIRQGKEFYANDTSHNGMSPIREAYMVSNFVDVYGRCGGRKIMGIYGSYHTELGNPDLMAGRLAAQYGNTISSIKLSSLAFGKQRPPYAIGFCATGLVFLLMLFIPNIIWAKSRKPEGYDAASQDESKILRILERAGEAAVSASLLIFTAINPHVKKLPEGVFFEWRILFWLAAFVLMVLYECFWVRYFRSKRTMADFYASFAGFPVAGATLPVIAALLLGLYAGNLILIASALVLGAGHIGIHVAHRNEVMAHREGT